MATRSHSRHRSAGRARRLTAFVSLLWLNVAMLPCTMAIADAHDCPGCPPVPDAVAMAHHGHGDSGAQHHHPAGDVPAPACGLDSPDCCEIDQVHVDDRTQKLDRDVQPPALAASDLSHASVAARSSVARPATGPPRTSTGSVRLHAWHCVYRD